MKNKSIKSILLLGIIMLTACGTENTKTNPVSNELIGEWNTICKDSNGYSQKNTAIYTSTRQALIRKKYNGEVCDENELISHHIFRFNYAIGSATKFSNGKDATEMSLVTIGAETKKGNSINIRNGLDIYMMYSILEGNLYIASEDDAGLYSGSTPSERRNKFPEIYYKKI